MPDVQDVVEIHAFQVAYPVQLVELCETGQGSLGSNSNTVWRCISLSFRYGRVVHDKGLLSLFLTLCVITRIELCA